MRTTLLNYSLHGDLEGSCSVSGAHGWLCRGKGCPDQNRCSRRERLDVHLGFPGLLKDQSLQKRKHHTRRGVSIEAPCQFSPSLSITERRCQTITLPNSALGNSPYALVEQRFGPELNGDLAPPLLFGILEQTYQRAAQTIEPLTNIGRRSEVCEQTGITGVTLRRDGFDNLVLAPKIAVDSARAQP